MNEAHAAKEPLVRIVKRDAIPLWKSLLIRAGAIVAALVVCALVIYSIVQMNPLKVYAAMWAGAFGTTNRIWITVRDTALLLCIGVGLAPAFKMHFWNTGAEGQILVGGIATAACMIYLKNIPTPLLLLIMFVCSAAAGLIWGVIPAFFKARWNTNETLFTLMMNYVAIQLTSFFVSKWEHPAGSNSVGIINSGTKAGWFPPILGQEYLLNVLIVLTLTVLVYFYLRSTKHGYEIAVVGESENTARYIGIKVRKVIVRTMCLSGTICGVAGFILVSGMSRTISSTTAGGRGFTAIIVAWLAQFNTFVMVLIALLLVFLDKGASQIASQYSLNEYASKIIIGIILFFILGSEFFIRYKLILRGKKEAE
jgi:ABC-type uncharacterized transport system permease subunit